MKGTFVSCPECGAEAVYYRKVDQLVTTVYHKLDMWGGQANGKLWWMKGRVYRCIVCETKVLKAAKEKVVVV